MNFTSGTRLAMRGIIARAVAGHALGSEADALEYAYQRWPGDSPITTKTAIGGSTSLDWSVAASPAILFDAVIDASIVGRAKLRQVPANVRLLAPSDATRGYWVGQSKAIPLSKMTLDGSSLPTRKVGAVICTTRESLETPDPRVERALEADFRRALSYAIDEAFIDPTSAGIAGERPAAVTYGAPASASTGDVRTDLHELLEHFSGDISAAVLVMHPQTALQIALVTDSSGSLVFPDIGPGGGSLLQIPVLTSRAVPWDTSGGSISLIDGSGIAATLEGMEVTNTGDALLEMSDAPTGAADTPSAATASLLSLFQVDAVGFKSILFVNWERQRTGCVSVITGASYT